MAREKGGLPPDFPRMSKRQALAYLEVFVDELPASRARLAQMLAAAGVDPGLAEDLSPDSLDPIWAVATGAWDLSWQPDYIPGPTAGDPPVRFATMEALGPVDQLPSWFRHGTTHYLRFSPPTLWVIDVLGRHLGECLVSAHPDLAWVPGPGAPKHHSHEKNWPLVGTRTEWASPLAAVSGLVHRQIDGAGRNTPVLTLRETFERMSETFHTTESDGENPLTVGSLVEMGALQVRALDPADASDRELLRDGFQHEVWVGDEARLLYDDEAALRLDRALAERPGIVAVRWDDREVLHVNAPGLAADGVLAAVADAMRDPRVRAGAEGRPGQKPPRTM